MLLSYIKSIFLHFPLGLSWISYVWPLKPPTRRLLPLSPSLSLPLTFLLHVQTSLSSSWLLEFTECRPLHMLLHPCGAIVLVPFLHNLANSCFHDTYSRRGPLSQANLVLPAVPSSSFQSTLCDFCSNILQFSIYSLLYISMSWLLLNWQALTLR